VASVIKIEAAALSATSLADGVAPLQYMLTVMRDPTASTSRRDKMAALAAPYCHVRATDAALGKKTQRQEQADEASSSGRFAVRPSPHLTAGKKAAAQAAADTAGHNTGWGSDLDTTH
jgi:hypothetical protein